MKKLVKVMNLGLSLFLLAGCSSEDSLLTAPNTNNNSNNVGSGYKVSVDDAISMARKAVSECGAPATRSYATAHVSAISPKYKTRSAELPDTLLYVVNFENDGGFAVVGADKRAMPIYAVSEIGQLELNDDSPEALKIIMEGIQLDAAEKIAESSSPESDSEILPGKPAPEPWENMPALFISPEGVGPHISHFQSRVSYTGDFSKYIFNSKGDKTQSGCVAVAAEILMSFYKWPQTIYYQAQGSNFFKRYTFNWDNIDETENVDAVARFLWIIGSPDYLALKYGDSPTSIAIGYDISIPYAISKLGYQSGGYYKDFLTSVEIAREELKTKPLLMFAQAVVPFAEKSGHAWVIDGWKIYKWYTLVRDPENPYYEVRDDYNGYMYHCVWGGTNGSSNGYYYIKNKYDKLGFYFEPDELGDDDNPDSSWSQWNYHNTDIRFLYGVEK